MYKQFCIICGNETSWNGTDSEAPMCDDCKSHLITPMLDFFAAEDEFDFD